MENNIKENRWLNIHGKQFAERLSTCSTRISKHSFSRLLNALLNKRETVVRAKWSRKKLHRWSSWNYTRFLFPSHVQWLLQNSGPRKDHWAEAPTNVGTENHTLSSALRVSLSLWYWAVTQPWNTSKVSFFSPFTLLIKWDSSSLSQISTAIFSTFFFKTGVYLPKFFLAASVDFLSWSSWGTTRKPLSLSPVRRFRFFSWKGDTTLLIFGPFHCPIVRSLKASTASERHLSFSSGTTFTARFLTRAVFLIGFTVGCMQNLGPCSFAPEVRQGHPFWV